MKNYKTIYGVFLTLFLSILLTSCSSGEESNKDLSGGDPDPITKNVEKSILDVAYGAHPQQKYDVYLPANRDAKTTKSIVLIHGGGWTSGDKGDMNPFVSLLQRNHPNLAIFNLNYILAGPGIPAFPNQREDIVSAFAHINSNTTSYNISEDFGILGTSAGAHLGMLYGFNKANTPKIKMIVNIVGPVDFTDAAYLEAETKELIDVLQALKGEAEIPENPFLEEFSPVFLVHEELPPVLSFYGNMDPLIPNSQHERLDAQLKALESSHQITVFDGGHADWDAASYFDLNAKLKEFVNAYLE